MGTRSTRRSTALALGLIAAMSMAIIPAGGTFAERVPPRPVQRQIAVRVSLLAPAGAAFTARSSADAASVALGYVRAHPAELGVTAVAVQDVYVHRQFTLSSGLTAVHIGQRLAGRRVLDGVITVMVDADGRVVSAVGTLARGTPKGTATLTARRALDLSAARQGAKPRRVLREADNTTGRRRTFENVYAQNLANPTPVSSELVWFIDDKARRLRLAWLTDVESSDHQWNEMALDARTGAELMRRSRYAHTGPEGTVFQEQHPEAAGATRQVTSFSGIDGSWVTDRTTSGNNVNAYLDRTSPFNDNGEYQPQTPANGDPAYQHFNYAWTDTWRTTANVDSVAALDADRDAIITQLFYYTNVLHDWLYGYGFDEASGNFQVNNFGRGGAGGDPVLAEAQDGWDLGCTDDQGTPNPGDDVAIRCLNNANFGTPGDGGSPRMQMYMWAPGRPFRDGSMDGDVIAHEYGHGVSSRLVGGGNLGYANDHRGALGEGWSDVVSYLKWGDAVVGEYVTGNATTGIRSVSYDNSNLTFQNYNPSSGSPHPNGEIWASVIYDIRAVLGLNTTAQLVLDGMKATPANPNFINARDALLTADGGTNRCLIWSAFAGRGLGTGSTIANVDAVPTASAAVPPECLPTAEAGGPYVTPEGTDVTLDGTGSAEGTDPSAGAIVLYEWDLNNDSVYDITGSTVPFTTVGQDGVFLVTLRVTDAFGNTATDTATVTVTNVAPTVSINPITPIDEFGTVTVSGVVTDPGWLDPLTATIDFDDGAGPQPLAGVLENVRPDATLTFSVQHQYGDNGVYSVQVCAADDDTTGNCSSSPATVNNVVPTVAIDTAGETTYDGVTAFVLHAGETLTVPLDATDPGSDDLTLTWDWGDGSPDSTATSLVNPPALDPAKSPSVQPRDISLSASHVYGDACIYTLTGDAVDDDGGNAVDDTAVVIITGNATQARSKGFWQTNYRRLPASKFTDAQLQCYLDITVYLSMHFNSPLTLAQAADILKSNASSSTPGQFDSQLLAAWLNFANGSYDLDTPVDTDGNGTLDSTFGAAVLNAETVAATPGVTKAQLLVQKNILERLNLRDGG